MDNLLFISLTITSSGPCTQFGAGLCPQRAMLSAAFSSSCSLGSKLHLTKCSALAFLACFLSTLLLNFAVHIAAASSRSLTHSGVLIIYLSFCAFVQCCIFLAACSIVFCAIERSSSLSLSFFHDFPFKNHVLLVC